MSDSTPTLTVLPKLPEFFEPPKDYIFLTGHDKVGSFLTKSHNVSGTLIKPDGCDDFQTDGCMFVPEHLGESFEIFVFKTIDMIKADSVIKLQKSLESRFEDINERFSRIGGNFAKQSKVNVSVMLLIDHKKKLEKADIEDLKNELKKLMGGYSNNIIKVRTLHVSPDDDRNTMKSVLAECYAHGAEQPLEHRQLFNASTAKIIMKEFIESFEDLMTNNCVDGADYNYTGGDTFQLTNEEKVNKLVDTFYPKRNTCLQTIPPFDSLNYNILHKTTKDGSLSNSLPKNQNDKELDEYFGEIQNFWQQVISNLGKNRAGILIKNFEKKHIKKILHKDCDRLNFELDWLHIGSDHVVTYIEICRLNDPKKPKWTIQTKLSQVFKRMATLEYILFLCLKKIYDQHLM